MGEASEYLTTSDCRRCKWMIIHSLIYCLSFLLFLFFISLSISDLRYKYELILIHVAFYMVLDFNTGLGLRDMPPIRLLRANMNRRLLPVYECGLSMKEMIT
jgi:hypothetical protein